MDQKYVHKNPSANLLNIPEIKNQTYITEKYFEFMINVGKY